VEIYSIGFTKRSAEEFFGALEAAGIQRLMDVRLNSRSQLAGFTKGADLAFFLKRILGTSYVQEPSLAPTQEMLSAYRRQEIAWSVYETEYLRLIETRDVERHLDRASFEVRTVLLCSEREPTRCHRRLAAEYLAARWDDMEIRHL
jgi:uncharacterized protein (DUF488 family)